MRVLLVDDHPLFLEGLKNLLLANDIEVVGVANDGVSAALKAKELQPDVVLMDVQMPGADGLEGLRRIKLEMPQSKVVMLTVSSDDAYLFEAIKAGAAGYLLKGMAKETFLEALHSLACGEAPLAPGLAAKVLQEFARREQSRAAEVSFPRKPMPLTAKQIEVLTLVAEGMTYKEVGESIGLSLATIKYHMREIMNQLELENRAQLIVYAAQAGLTKKNELA